LAYVVIAPTWALFWVCPEKFPGKKVLEKYLALYWDNVVTRKTTFESH